MGPKRSPRKTVTRTKGSPATSSSPKKKAQAGFECQICFVVSESQEDYVNHILQAHSAPPRQVSEAKVEPKPEAKSVPLSVVTTYEEIVQDIVEEADDELPEPEQEEEETVEETEDRPEEESNTDFVSDLHTSANQCPDCKKTYQTPSHYKRHRESKCGKEKKFSCNFCQAEFISESTLTTHMLIHGGEKKFSCKFCGKAFLSNGQLKVHLRQHTQETPFECSVCFKKFAYRESLVTHTSIHTGIKPYQCLNCKHQFSCIGNLIKHRKTRQSTCGLPEFCKNVKIAPRPNTKIPGTLLMTPLQKKKKGQEEATLATPSPASGNSSTSTKARVGKGKRAGRSSRNKTISPELESQVIFAPETEFMDSDGQGPSSQEYVVLEFEVEKAEMEDQQDQQLEEEAHQESQMFSVSEATAVIEEVDEEEADDPDRIGTRQIIGNYVIDIVEESSSSALPAKKPRRQIVKTVEEDAAFKCTVCFETFTSESAALAHKLNAHFDGEVAAKKPKAMRFNCNKCIKSFAVLRSLQKHEASGCGILLDHICPVCEKSYATASTLRTHLSFHNDERPYQCEECSKRFRTPVQLSVHLRVHTGERPYKCDKCPREFAHRETLLTHESIHTGYKRFICINCGDRFSCISNLQSHRRARKKTCGLYPAHTRPVGENEDIKPLMINQ